MPGLIPHRGGGERPQGITAQSERGVNGPSSTPPRSVSGEGAHRARRCLAPSSPPGAGGGRTV
jgi:hypothetical protein